MNITGRPEFRDLVSRTSSLDLCFEKSVNTNSVHSFDNHVHRSCCGATNELAGQQNGFHFLGINGINESLMLHVQGPTMEPVKRDYSTVLRKASDWLKWKTIYRD